MKLALAFIFILLISNIAISYAFAPEEQLPAAQEERAKNLFMRVKCLVCDGQVIAASDTEIAYNLRKLIRQKIAQNYSDEEIKSYLIKHYGQDILTSPSFNRITFLLWVLPAIFVIAGIFILLKFSKN